MKTPVSYYGGKQKLVSEILALIPAHTHYVEPFFGGGAVFWAKQPSIHETLNDLDGRVVNFYRVLQLDFERLQRLVQATCHSEAEYFRAKQALASPAAKPLKRAWAFWVQANMSFGNKLGGGFAHSATFNTGKADEPRKSTLKRETFTTAYAQRIELAEIFCRDAVALIKLKDCPTAFFYIDPPYLSSHCGHYQGYTKADFQRLLEACAEMKGKFLLSSYPEPELLAARAAHGWRSKDIQSLVAVSGKRVGQKLKTECLTYNYSLAAEPIGLFASEHLTSAI
jgi:DNA adenine methylase